MRHWNAIGPRTMPNGMIEPNHPKLSVGAQCCLLSISRSSFYYSPMGETDTNLSLMLKIDKQFLNTPFSGVRQMTWHLRKSEGPWPQWGRVSPKTAIP